LISVLCTGTRRQGQNPSRKVTLSDDPVRKLAKRQAVPGRRYVLQTSTNLSSWAPILTNTAVASTLLMPDSSLVNKTRFYRVAIP
jgi:hypothetical protein